VPWTEEENKLWEKQKKQQKPKEQVPWTEEENKLWEQQKKQQKPKEEDWTQKEQQRFNVFGKQQQPNRGAEQEQSSSSSGLQKTEEQVEEDMNRFDKQLDKQQQNKYALDKQRKRKRATLEEEQSKKDEKDWYENGNLNSKYICVEFLLRAQRSWINAFPSATAGLD
jgi:hypothetical protein